MKVVGSDLHYGRAMAGFTAGQGGQEEPGVSKFSFLAERLVILYNRRDEAEGESFLFLLTDSVHYEILPPVSGSGFTDKREKLEGAKLK